MRGLDDNFDRLITEIARIGKEYDLGKIKYIGYSDQIDQAHKSFGWSKAEFVKEINCRLSKHSKDCIHSLAKKPAPVKKKPGKRAAKK